MGGGHNDLFCAAPHPGRSASRRTVLEYVQLPVRNITSVCFGGRELRENERSYSL